MKSKIESIIREKLPQQLTSRIKQRKFANEIKANKLVDLKIGDIIIKCPENHPLMHWSLTQPYRNLSLGISAKFFGDKYPGHNILDIGANIGDTAAMIASFTDNPMILVEPSDVYYPIIKSNCSSISNVKRLEKSYIINGCVNRGELIHRGGTAAFEQNENSNNEIDSKSLAEIADRETKFIKIDTDGYDYSIINSSLDWLSNNLPILYFENEIFNDNLLHVSNQTFDNLSSIGYEYFVIWDDKGLHIFSTESISDIRRLNYYLHKTRSNGKIIPGIWGTNVLCVSGSDIDIWNSVNKYYEEY